MIDFKLAFKKPFSDIRLLLIGLAISIVATVLAKIAPDEYAALGGVLEIVSLLIGFFLSGYYIKVAVMTFKKKKGLPEWKGWRKLFVNGLLVTVLGIIYAIPVILLSIIFGGLNFLSAKATDILAMPPTMVVGLIVTFIVGVFIIYILPAAVLAFAKKGKLGAAFDFRDIVRRAFTKVYFLSWFVAGLYAIALGLILKYIPYVGSPVASFITSITGITLLAQAYMKTK